MEAIRIGNDILIRWSIFKKEDSSPYFLEGKDIVVTMSSIFKKGYIEDFKVAGNTVEFMFYGKDQKHPGIYSLTLEENKGRDGMKTVDVCDAFKLVPKSCLTNCESKVNVELITIRLDSALSVGGGQSDGTSDYNSLANKPSINGVQLVGNKGLDELGIQKKGDYQPAGDYVVKGDLESLQQLVNTLVSGDASSAIESFNEIIAFLANVEDSETLAGIIAGINQSIANVRSAIPTKLSELDNDDHTVKDADYVHTDNNYSSEDKAKLAGLSNYDDTEVKEGLESLQRLVNTLVSGDASSAIESFNEIIAFLANVEDSETLAGIIAGINQSIASVRSAIPTKLSELDNDDHTVKDADYVHTDNNYSNGDKTKVSDSLRFKDIFTATSLSNLPIAYYSIKVTLSSARALSFASTPYEGWECMIDIKNTGSSVITQALPNASGWQCDVASITINPGKIASISVRYVHGTYVVLAKGN